MPGVKGRSGKHSNRSNQWIAGTKQRTRARTTFGYRPSIDLYDKIEEDIKTKGVTTSQWFDLVVKKYFEKEKVNP